jgi:hypothetical protein
MKPPIFSISNYTFGIVLILKYLAKVNFYDFFSQSWPCQQMLYLQLSLHLLAAKGQKIKSNNSDMGVSQNLQVVAIIY